MDLPAVIQIALARIPEDLRPAAIEILTEPKITSAQRRLMLLKKGLLKSTVDELEVLDSKGESFILL
jgi:translation initiation factor 2-alpha kinase 4